MAENCLCKYKEMLRYLQARDQKNQSKKYQKDYSYQNHERNQRYQGHHAFGRSL